ncbi:UbiA prenyltransferase [Gyrodon lividus]|nr:UbiA prenyltransferase [Gyrodon lividus]
MTEKSRSVNLKPPSKWRLYLELSRLNNFPLGSERVFWPCAWASTLAAYQAGATLDVLSHHVLIFGIASTLLHSAGCVTNDILDAEYDRQVERTKSRPLPSGNLSLPSAAMFLAALTAGSLLCLSLASPLAFRVGLFGIFPLYTLYPFMKRWTHWPQAWLGLAMNWGIFAAWVWMVEMHNYHTPTVLFAGAWAWTIIYDTIYASQDKRDDAKAGIGSTALVFGYRVRTALSLFALVFVTSLTYVGVTNRQSVLYFAVSVGGAGLHLLWQLATLDFDEPTDCAEKFQSNGTLGFIVWLGIFLDYNMNTYSL